MRLGKKRMTRGKGLIIRACWAYHNPASGILERVWHFDYIENRTQLKVLAKKWYDVEIVASVENEKIFCSNPAEFDRTYYYVYKCNNNATFIKQIEINIYGISRRVKRSKTDFEKINSLREAQEAFL
jgi:hypothetical protein